VTGGERFWLIAIAASAGGIPALQTVLRSLPSTIPAAIVIVQHRPPTVESFLDQILSRVTEMPVASPQIGDAIRPGCVYVARPDLHLTVQPTRRFSYVDGVRVRGVFSSANPLLETAAEVFKDRTIAVVLTGSGLDATDGVQRVKTFGGIVIVQDPATASYGSMPSAALSTGVVDQVLPLEAIGPALVAITTGAQAGPASA
jgi:two-component system chemotaxis response regulator CheB